MSTEERLARLGLTHLRSKDLLAALDALVTDHAKKADAFHASRQPRQRPQEEPIIDELAAAPATDELIEAWVKVGGGTIQHMGGTGGSAGTNKRSSAVKSNGTTSRKITAPAPADEAAMQKLKAAFADKIVKLGLVKEVTELLLNAPKLPEPMRLLVLNSLDDAKTSDEIKDIIAQMQPMLGP